MVSQELTRRSLAWGTHPLHKFLQLQANCRCVACFVVSGFLCATAAARMLMARGSSDRAQLFCLLPTGWTCSWNPGTASCLSEEPSPLLGKCSVELTSRVPGCTSGVSGDVIPLQLCPICGHGAVPRKAWPASQASLSKLGYYGREGA